MRLLERNILAGLYILRFQFRSAGRCFRLGIEARIIADLALLAPVTPMEYCVVVKPKTHSIFVYTY